MTDSEMVLCDHCGWEGHYPHATGVCPQCRLGMDIGNHWLWLQRQRAATAPRVTPNPHP